MTQPRRHVKIRKETSSSSSGSQSTQPKPKAAPFQWPSSLTWIPNNFTYSKLKPVIRSSVAAWISLVLFVIPKVQVFLGQASFLVLIAAFLSPPSDSFMGVFEREIIILTFVAMAWAWTCLGLKLASLARSSIIAQPSLAAVYTGQYIEAAPSVILAVFIFFGTAFFLYLKARQGPGPYLFASVFACICIDISLTTAVLYPYPFYYIGRSIIIPLAFHSAISLLCSIFIFPRTVSAQFTTLLQLVIDPLLSAFEHHRALLDLNVSKDKDAFKSHFSILKAKVAQSEGGLVPLAATGRLLNSDLIICRFGPLDFKPFHESLRRLAVRANGMTVYFTLIDPNKEKFPITPIPSQVASPVASRPPSPERLGEKDEDLRNEKRGRSRSQSRQRSSQPSTPESPVATLRKQHHHHHHAHSHHHHPHHHHHHSLLHSSLLHLSISRHSFRHDYPVGVFESQRYLNLEVSHFSDDPEIRDRNIQQATELLKQSCSELLDNAEKGLKQVQGWFDTVRHGRLGYLFFSRAKERESKKQRLDQIIEVKEQLDGALRRFKAYDRHAILAPYQALFENEEDREGVPAHRYLFNCYVYQYHLMQFALRISSLLEQIIKLEQERKNMKLWTPAHTLFSWHTWQATEDQQNDEENPELIQGVQPSWDLGEPHRRDPDVLPPANVFQWIMNKLYLGAAAFGRGNGLFAIKAATLTIIMCIPNLLKSTAKFAYVNHFVWAVFMGQLTLARFRGDTAFGLTARIMSTFFGGIVGMVVWYISQGNPYGLAAVCGVCFPFFFYARLYWPGPPMTNIIFFVTVALVFGYSYQDKYTALPGSPGFGWDVAWRRFVLVTCGVVAAFLFSFLPPSTTIRLYQRLSLSTTSSELGTLFCSIVGYANVRLEEEVQEIVTSLIALRSKLKRSIIMKQNAAYEFSLRGEWPAERYHKITELQLSIAYSLSHLMSVVERLEPSWGRALLRRTRFLDSDFQGDLLAVISMISTSFRTGTPLPQITPCPLLDRFMLRVHGLDIIHKESEEDYGLPRSLSRETLENEQYLMFCVGVSTAYRIVTDLDKLMIAVKELVGEQYHIHGAGLNWAKGVPLGSRTNSVAFNSGV